ncbi:BamA/TamA family outer membrane protein [Gemmobacter lanyuensis]
MEFGDSLGDWHAGAGLGLRYNTGFGPIRLDIAAPVGAAAIPGTECSSMSGSGRPSDETSSCACALRPSACHARPGRRPRLSDSTAGGQPLGRRAEGDDHRLSGGAVLSGHD